MDANAIEIYGLSKSYVIKHKKGAGYRRLSEELLSWPGRLTRGIGSLGSSRCSSEEFWALKDITFHVSKGDVVGVIGQNGAGKSTLLKVLSRITDPTEGYVRLRGRVSSLLEVGTGFHPELTGRENIFLNGAILGMRRREVQAKFDDIVDFAGVEKFLDTPVKRYSSGMYVRLAFSVAAHLDPEILVVDEVLSVGDAEFQKRCLGRMSDVASSGRTILFVSHNLSAVQSLCTNCILLTGGRLSAYGKTDDVISTYLSVARDSQRHSWAAATGASQADVEISRLHASQLGELNCADNCTEFAGDAPIEVLVQVDFHKPMKSIAIELFFNTLDGVVLFCAFTKASDYGVGTRLGRFIVPANLFNDGTYSVTAGISQDYSQFVTRLDDVLQFDVRHRISELGWNGRYPGIVRPKVQWTIE